MTVSLAFGGENNYQKQNAPLGLFSDNVAAWEAGSDLCHSMLRQWAWPKLTSFQKSTIFCLLRCVLCRKAYETTKGFGKLTEGAELTRFVLHSLVLSCFLMISLIALPAVSDSSASSARVPFQLLQVPAANAGLEAGSSISTTTADRGEIALDMEVSNVWFIGSDGNETFVDALTLEVLAESSEWYVVLRGSTLDEATNIALVVSKNGVSGFIGFAAGASIRVDGGRTALQYWIPALLGRGVGQPLFNAQHGGIRSPVRTGNTPLAMDAPAGAGSENSIVVSKHIHRTPAGIVQDPVNAIFYGDMAEGVLLLQRNQWWPTLCASPEYALILDARHGGTDAWVGQDNDYERDGVCWDARHHARRYSAWGDWHVPGFGFYALVPVHWECAFHSYDCVDPQRGQDRLYTTLVQDPRVKGVWFFRPDTNNLDCYTCSRWNGWTDMYWVERPDSTNIDPCGIGKTAAIEFSGSTKMLKFECLGSGGGGGGGSPFVAAWNGAAYENDNNILPLSEVFTRTALDVPDHYRLRTAVVPKDGTYSLKLVEFEEERSYVDSVGLWAVDHDPDTKVGVHPQTGELITYETGEPPASAMDNYGRDVLAPLLKWDGTFYQGWRGDFIELNFGRVPQDDARLVIVADSSHKIKTRIFVLVWDGTTWEVADTMHHRINFAEDVIDLSRFVPTGSDLRVRLLGASRFAVEQISLDTSPPRRVTVQAATLINAVHSSGRDVTDALAVRDGIYGTLVPGEEISLAFGIPSFGDEGRSLIFVSYGHYRHKYQPLQGTDVSIRGLDVFFEAVIPQAPPGQYWDVEVSELLWNFGDGSTPVTGLRLPHTYNRSGEYTVTIRVSYSDGTSRLDRRVIILVDK